MDPYRMEEPGEVEKAVAAERRRGHKHIVLSIVVTAVCAIGVLSAGFYLLFGSTLRTASKYRPILDAAQVIEERFIAEYDSQKMTEEAIDGFVNALGDRWSYYVTPEELESYRSNVTNSYVGIGVTVHKEEGQPLAVEKISADSGALEAGLAIGDRITAVDEVSILEMTLAEARALIVGEEGTMVTLTVLHTDGSQEDMEVERRRMVNDPIAWELQGNVGYIKIKNFNSGAADGFKTALQELQAQGAEAFVFDVRFNGGGLVTQLTAMLDVLLPEGEIFRMVDKAGNAKITHSDAASLDVPMAVLVNDNSYSAAEFFAACLAEYGAADVVGTHTTGKGYAQTSYYLSDGSCLNLSSAAYYTPAGLSLANVGIAPDVELDLNEEDYAALYADRLAFADDEQWNAAVENVLQKLQ